MKNLHVGTNLSSLRDYTPYEEKAKETGVLLNLIEGELHAARQLIDVPMNR